MDITCPQCKTEYEFDDEKVTEAGITVKCTSCSYMFKVRRKSVVETGPVTQPPDFRGAGKGAEKRWMIRTQSGQLFTFNELTTLQQWIVERKVIRDDQISRSGDTWKRLGDIAELASFFQVVDAAVAAASPPPGAPMVAPSRPVATNEPAFSADSGQFRDVGPSAAWESGGDRLGSRPPLSTLPDEEVPRTSLGKLIGVSTICVALLGIALAAFLMRDRLKGLLTGNGTERSDASYQAGRQLFLLDDEDSLRKADEALARAPKPTGVVLAARAEVFTTWAQHLREEAILLEHKALRLEAQALPPGAPDPKAAPPPTGDDPKLIRLAATKLRDEASQKLRQAEGHVRAALAAAADRSEVHRAMADYLRLRGDDPQGVQRHIDEARRLSPDDAETLYVLGAREADTNRAAQARQTLEQALAKTRTRYGQTLIRAAFLLALLHLQQDRGADARPLVESALQANPMHRWASLLLAELDAPKVAAAPPPGPDAGLKSPSADSRAEPRPEPKTEPKPEDTPLAGGNFAALVKQGIALSERGRTMQAMKAFEQALKLQPQSADALTGLGYCHLDQERFASATSHFMRALNIEATHGDALIGMAEAYKVQGNLSKALDYYRAYVTALPSGNKAIMARRNVAELERKVGVTPGPAPGPQPTPTPDPAPAPAPAPTPAPAPSTDVPPPAAAPSVE